jgi:hypothetical protein
LVSMGSYESSQQNQIKEIRNKTELNKRFIAFGLLSFIIVIIQILRLIGY